MESTSEENVSSRYIKHVLISGIKKRYKPNRHYVYILRVKWSDKSSYIIYRSYSSFFEFHNELVDRFPVEAGLLSEKDRCIPKFPRRKFYQNTELHKFAVQYQSGMEEYCRTILGLKQKISRHPFVQAFFLLASDDICPSEEDTKKPDRTSSLLKALLPFWMKKESRSSYNNLLDISSPIQTEEYRAIENYKAEVTGQVSFKKNDVMRVIEKNPSGWWMVEHNSKQGWAPGSYLEIVVAQGAQPEAPDQPEINLDGEVYVTLCKYNAQMKDEIGFEEGCCVKVIQKRLDGWWIIKYNKEIGYAPAAYLVEYANEDYEVSVLQDTVFSSGQSMKTPLPSFVQVMVDRQISAKRNANGDVLRIHGSQMNLPLPKRKCSFTKDESPSSERVLTLVRSLSSNREEKIKQTEENMTDEGSFIQMPTKPSRQVKTPRGNEIPKIQIIPPTSAAMKRQQAYRSSTISKSRSADALPALVPKEIEKDDKDDEDDKDDKGDKDKKKAVQNSDYDVPLCTPTEAIMMNFAVTEDLCSSTQAISGSVDAYSRHDELADYSVNVSPIQISDSLIQVVESMKTPRQNLFEAFAPSSPFGSKPVGNVRPYNKNRRPDERVQKWIDELKTKLNSTAVNNLTDVEVSTAAVVDISADKTPSYLEKLYDQPSSPENTKTTVEQKYCAPINDIMNRLMKVADNLQLELDLVRQEKLGHDMMKSTDFEKPIVDKSISSVQSVSTQYSPQLLACSGATEDLVGDISCLPKNVQESVLKIITDSASEEEQTFTITVIVKPQK